MTRQTIPIGRRSRRIAGLVVAVAIVAAACGDGGAGSATDDGTTRAAAAMPRSGPMAPATPFEMFDGTGATLADYQGRPLVVNFWASWCPSCVAEMSAAFRPVQQRLGDRVEFLGMNLQDERAKALEMVDETGVLFDLAEDPRGDLYAELGGLGMPFTVFISADGRILEEHNGPVTETQLEDMIREVFALS